MKPDYNLCDRCGGKAPERPIFVCTDSRMDGAGSMEDVGDTVDLCPRCLRHAIDYFLKSASHEDGQAFLDWANKKK